MPKVQNKRVSDNAEEKSKSDDKAESSDSDKKAEEKNVENDASEMADKNATEDGKSGTPKSESGDGLDLGSSEKGIKDTPINSIDTTPEDDAKKADSPETESSHENTDTSCEKGGDVEKNNTANSNIAKSNKAAETEADSGPSKQSNAPNTSNPTSRASNSNPSPASVQTNTTSNSTIPTTVTTTTPSPPVATQQNANQPVAPTMQARSQPTTTQLSEPADFDDDYNSDSKDTLLKMTFNQDGGCLAVGTGSGFRICNVNPFQETFRRSLGGGSVDGGGGGIAHIEMLYRTNLLAITGHSTSPQYPPNKVFIYDDHLNRTIGELIFRQKVLTTKLRRDRIVVVLRDRVYIYNFSDLALLDKVHTGDNPLGLIGISMDNGGVGGSTTSVERAEDALGSGSAQRNNGMVLACPSTQRGQVRVELYGLRRTTFVDAHESHLGALALSADGSLLATASERGTVIRLFDTRGVTIGGGTSGGGAKKETTSVSSSVPLREFRRGVERATISCLTFSRDSNWLAIASDHGTVHIFQTQDPHNNTASTEKKSRSSSMTGKAIRMLPKLVTSPKKYLMDGVHSSYQVRGVPHPQACAFVPDREQTLAVAGVDEYGNGCLLLAEFGKLSNNIKKADIGDSSKVEDSEARRLGYHRFFKCKSPASQTGSSRRRTKSSTKVIVDDTVEGGAYIDDAPVDMRMNHISIGDENEDHFVPIDYNEAQL